MRDSRGIVSLQPLQGGVSRDDSKQFIGALETLSTDEEKYNLLRSYNHSITTKNAANQVIRRAFSSAGVPLTKEGKEQFYIKREPSKFPDSTGVNEASSFNRWIYDLKDATKSEPKSEPSNEPIRDLPTEELHEALNEATQSEPSNEPSNEALKEVLDDVKQSEPLSETKSNRILNLIRAIPNGPTLGEISKSMSNKMISIWNLLSKIPSGERFREAHELMQDIEDLAEAEKRHTDAWNAKKKALRDKLNAVNINTLKKQRNAKLQDVKIKSRELFNYIRDTPMSMIESHLAPLKKYIEDHKIFKFKNLTGDLRDKLQEFSLLKSSAQAAKAPFLPLDVEITQDTPVTDSVNVSIRQKTDNKKSSYKSGNLVKKMVKFESKNTKPRKAGKPPKTNKSHIIDEMVKHGKNVIVI